MESFALCSFTVLNVIQQHMCLRMFQACVQVKSHKGKGLELMEEFWLLKAS